MKPVPRIPRLNRTDGVPITEQAAALTGPLAAMRRIDLSREEREKGNFSPETAMTHRVLWNASGFPMGVLLRRKRKKRLRRARKSFTLYITAYVRRLSADGLLVASGLAEAEAVAFGGGERCSLLPLWG